MPIQNGGTVPEAASFQVRALFPWPDAVWALRPAPAAVGQGSVPRQEGDAPVGRGPLSRRRRCLSSALLKGLWLMGLLSTGIFPK